MSRHARVSRFSLTMLALGFLFLYVPILSLIVYSFNESKLVTVWAGFSVKWYFELFRDQQMIDAAKVSLKLAFLTACAAVVLGTMAAMVMTRFRSFRGKTLFSALITAPLVMPEVITGLSMLLLFVSLGDWFGFFQQRSVATMWIAHVTFTVSFVTVIVSSRLAELDRSLEEAAMDLGATPLRAFWSVIVPYLRPAIIAGALMSFTLSLGEYIVSVFTTGAQSQTLPLKIYGMAKVGLNPQLNALSALFIAATFVVAIASHTLAGKKPS